MNLLCVLGYFLVSFVTYRILGIMLNQVSDFEKKSIEYKAGIVIVSIFWPLLWSIVAVIFSIYYLRHWWRTL